MNRRQAKEIAEKITNKELKTMLEKARKKITNWEVRSKVNPNLSRGTAWNILGKDFIEDRQYHNLTKINMVREFGEFLEGYEKKPEGRKKKPDSYRHEKPDFSGFE